MCDRRRLARGGASGLCGVAVTARRRSAYARAMTRLAILVAAVGLGAGACSDDAPAAKDPLTAERVPIDRFSAAAGHWFVRDRDPSLPAANEAIDYDARFAVQGLGPAGEAITMYLFDVQATTPAPIYVLFHEGEQRPVTGQKNIVTVIPGDPGYNDLWQPVRVDVPGDYVANTVTSFDEIVAAGYPQTPMAALVNCPVVPDGSVARVRTPGDYAELDLGWYQGKRIQYFHFGERPSLAPVAGVVPTSSIYLAFADDQGPPLATDAGQAHAVIAAMPGDPAYSPLVAVHAYAASALATVHDLASAQAAPVVTTPATIINAPLVRAP